MEHIKHCNPQVASAKRANNSFTLIELLIVIAIIAILSAVIVASTSTSRQKARDARRIQDLNDLATALEVYYSDHKSYPQGNIGPGSSSSDQGFCIEKATGTNQFQSILTQGNYLSTIPKDPLYQDVSDPDYCYWYQTKDNGQKFKLFAKAEKDNFEPAQKDGGLYDYYYEAYSINSGSNQIAFNASSGGGGFIICPSGYVLVSNNPNTIADDEYYTRMQKQSFCVMKYEAKYDCTGDKIGDTAAACSAPADSGAGLDWRDVSQTPNNVVSTAEGAPIVHITHTQALSACPSGSHLITNDEWMAIARNAEQVDSNWSGGSVGNGCLYRGNNGTPDACGYNGADPEQGTSRDNKAKLILQNGSEIWDIAGNVWEWTNNTIAQNNQPGSSNTCDDAAGTGCWFEFTEINDYRGLSYNVIRPSDSSWNSSNGVGKIWSYGDGEIATTNRAFRRGGYWKDGTGAGAFTLDLSIAPSGSNYGNGFRCAR